MREAEAHRTDDKGAQVERMREIAELQKHIKQLQAQEEQDKKDKLDIMRNMEQTTEQLDANASALERQPGSF